MNHNNRKLIEERQYVQGKIKKDVTRILVIHKANLLL